MHADTDFLRKLLENPADDTVRLVYADWLDEHADPVSSAKAEFLRVTCREAALGKKQRQRRKLALRRLQDLAADLDTGWLAVVSRTRVENCGAYRATGVGDRLRAIDLARQFDRVCDRQWDQLNPTDDRSVRFCEGCREKVHYCDTITEARQHAWARHCIAVAPGVIRRARDLEPELMVLGMPGPEFMRQERERMQPDPVSAAREARKRERPDNLVE